MERGSTASTSNGILDGRKIQKSISPPSPLKIPIFSSFLSTSLSPSLSLLISARDTIRRNKRRKRILRFFQYDARNVECTPPGFRPTKSAPTSPAKPLGVSRTRSESFHAIHKVPVGDSPYVRAKNVQLKFTNHKNRLEFISKSRDRWQVVVDEEY
ncbi:hypothetical protein NC651_018258 [Populus alba x Populus x berolinensis]|nr:hypothetical protein NC651_018258 [Populus alba x Populus x berolinensis]